MAGTGIGAAMVTVGIDDGFEELAAAIAARVYGSTHEVAMLARAMELVEAVAGLKGSEKKGLLLDVLRRIKGLADGDGDGAAPADRAADLVGPLIDEVVATSKRGRGEAVASADPSAAFAVFLTIRDLVDAARGREEGGALTQGQVAELLPQVVRALAGVAAFSAAAVPDQVAIAKQALAQVRARSPSAEHAAWDAAAAGIGPLIYALHAARAGELNVNTVVSAMADNPEAVATVCTTCLAALAAAFARRG